MKSKGDSMENLNDLKEYINDYEHVLDELDKIMNYVTDKELKDTISYLKDTFQLEEGRRYDTTKQKIEEATEEPDEVPSNDEMRREFISERMRELR
jgi:plasmid replication initiation protein